jgi:hypothetical protein
MRKLGFTAAILGIAFVSAALPALAEENTGPRQERYTEALNLLEAKGYGSFTNFQKFGNDFEASIDRDGKPQMMMIDPDQGTIKPMS